MSLEPVPVASWPAAERIPFLPYYVLYRAAVVFAGFQTHISVQVAADRDPGALFVRRRIANNCLWLDMIDADDVVYEQKAHSLAALGL